MEKVTIQKMTRKQIKENLSSYQKEVMSWETNKVYALERSKKTAWTIAIIATIAAFFLTISIIVLTPLKTVTPYVIRVDNSTGVVDIVEMLKDGKSNYDEQTNKYFLKLYVRYREGYSSSYVESFYQNVGLMSSQSEQSRYAREFDPKNKNSPLNVYGENGIVTIEFKSISFISEDIALVRYAKIYSPSSKETAKVLHLSATVKFKYLATKMTEKEREVNPLGFQVEEYRNDIDAAESQR